MHDNINAISLSASAEPKHFGSRLDQVLAELFSDFSRSRLKEWIQQGKVTVDGEICTRPRQKLKGDENIQVEAELAQEVHHVAESMEMDIVFEDEHVLVLNKTKGVVVHPGAGNPRGTLLNALLSHVPNIDQVPRAGIVHRLDKDTTGLMVVAKTIQAQTSLVEQLQNRTMGREYEAVCYGTMVAGGTVDEPIGRHPTKRTLMAVRDLAKPATTHYRVIEKFRAFTHLRLKLETGRTHQIRVHMAYIKHPLVGDTSYGGRTRLPKNAGEDLIDCLRGLGSQALHAIQLSFAHPVTAQELTFQAPLPEYFQSLLYQIRHDTEVHGLNDY